MSVRKMDDFDIGILQKENVIRSKNDANWDVHDVSTW